VVRGGFEAPLRPLPTSRPLRMVAAAISAATQSSSRSVPERPQRSGFNRGWAGWSGARPAG
jgi:hypothetical protein